MEGFFEHRLPRSSALDGATLRVRVGTGETVLAFARGSVRWQSPDGRRGTDPCDVIEVAPETFFIDICLRSADEREAYTLVVDRATGHGVSVVSAILPSCSASAPRVRHAFSVARLADAPPDAAGEPAVPTRDLVGRRLICDYGADWAFEHIYVNAQRYCWQCLRGEEAGTGDCNEASYWRIAEDRYLFAFRETMIDYGTVLFLDLKNLRATGKFHGIEADGTVLNGALGARVSLLATVTYPPGLEPV